MKSYVQIYTGNGKGKTTAALGLILRASGHNLRVLLVQFLKGRDYGELHSLAKFPNVEHRRYGRGVFIKNKENLTEEDIKLARDGYQLLKEAIVSDKYDIIVADEILGTLRYDLISEDEILYLIKNKKDDVELILTGRNATDNLIEAADLVTEMREVKHYFQKGVMARVGIEK